MKFSAMPSKLTLSIDQEVIDQAKAYASTHHRSLSDLVSNYLKTLSREADSGALPPVVQSLKGSFSAPPEMDYKEILADALAEKFGKR
jgi:hypothetical protein